MVIGLGLIMVGHGLKEEGRRGEGGEAVLFLGHGFCFEASLGSQGRFNLVGVRRVLI